MQLLEYILINNLIANSASPTQDNLTSLLSTNEYVIEKYKTEPDHNSNYEYKFIIHKNNEVQSFIQVGEWKITDLKSFYQWKPYQTLLFNLIDPKGVNSAGKELPFNWINKENISYIHVQGTDKRGFNFMLNLAKEASEHTYWLSFIKKKFESHIKEKYDSELLQLQKQVNVLNKKLTAIQSIITD